MAILNLVLACVDPGPDSGVGVVNGLGGDIILVDVPVANAFVFATEASNPPPPSGTGRPVDFRAVPAGDFDNGQIGLVEAPFALTGVADGDWILTALVDTDADFQPLLGVTAGATCGDSVGGYVADLESAQLTPLHLEGGQFLDGVPVLVGSTLTTERPAFVLENPEVDRTRLDPQILTLSSTPVHSTVLDLDGPFNGTDPCGTMFLLYAPDADSDGAPDPHPNPALATGGAYDIWPRIYLEYQDDGLAPGESYTAEAVVYPAPILSGAVPLGVPTPVTQLEVVWIPAARHTLADGTSVVISAADLPAGAWVMTVVSVTGQTWTVPNELADFPSTSADFDASRQGVALQVR